VTVESCDGGALRRGTDVGKERRSGCIGRNALEDMVGQRLAKNVIDNRPLSSALAEQLASPCVPTAFFLAPRYVCVTKSLVGDAPADAKSISVEQ
jgi:hypothetical protein